MQGAYRLGGKAITECLYFSLVVGCMASTLSMKNTMQWTSMDMRGAQVLAIG